MSVFSDFDENTSICEAVEATVELSDNQAQSLLSGIEEDGIDDKELFQLQAEFEELEDENMRWQSERVVLEAEIEAITETIGRRRNACQSAMDKATSFEKQIADDEASIEELKSKIEKLQSLEARLTDHGQKLHQRLSCFEAEIAELEASGQNGQSLLSVWEESFQHCLSHCNELVEEIDSQIESEIDGQNQTIHSLKDNASSTNHGTINEISSNQLTDDLQQRIDLALHTDMTNRRCQQLLRQIHLDQQEFHRQQDQFFSLKRQLDTAVKTAPNQEEIDQVSGRLEQAKVDWQVVVDELEMERQQFVDEVVGRQENLAEIYDKLAEMDRQQRDDGDARVDAQQQLVVLHEKQQHLEEVLVELNDRCREKTDFLSQLEDRVKTAEEKEAKLKAKLEELNNSLTESETTVSAMRKELEETGEEIERIVENLSAEDARLAELAERETAVNQRAADVEDQLAKSEMAVSHLEELKVLHDGCTERLKEARCCAENVDRTSDEALQERDELLANVGRLEEESAGAEETVAELKKRASQAQSELEDLERMIAAVTCDSDSDDLAGFVEPLDENASSSQSDCHQLTSQIDEKNDQLTTLKNLLTDYDGLSSKVAEVEELLADERSLFDDLKNRNEQLSGECCLLQSELDSFDEKGAELALEEAKKEWETLTVDQLELGQSADTTVKDSEEISAELKVARQRRDAKTDLANCLNDCDLEIRRMNVEVELCGGHLKLRKTLLVPEKSAKAAATVTTAAAAAEASTPEKPASTKQKTPEKSSTPTKPKTPAEKSPLKADQAEDVAPNASKSPPTTNTAKRQDSFDPFNFDFGSEEDYSPLPPPTKIPRARPSAGKAPLQKTPCPSSQKPATSKPPTWKQPVALADSSDHGSPRKRRAAAAAAAAKGFSFFSSDESFDDSDFTPPPSKKTESSAKKKPPILAKKLPLASTPKPPTEPNPHALFPTRKLCPPGFSLLDGSPDGSSVDGS